ncbi:hypothetical protein SAMN05421805_11952 [Saccharopolyspora antimicrobica]|uniref:CU044_5270 family protein n=1 Tax=Saccharopolyspora antimicrobica TaxID=455193 RepID=A0A1I5IPG6_9PSEU|nr:CU044_5270 family protein [Saccharopolyspora antimicrobica]RKT84073.1 hypothetical protein ATL45_2372 [Saccharopolyspora antimicrobica]SFO62096.1 hypothetical protein SAMN05421805_11952 [Saccharopolyspora antimicrobica]
MDVDEMKLIKEFGDSTPLPDRRQLLPARNRLVVAAAAERAGSAPAKRSWGRRWAWPTGMTVGLAAAISGVLALAPAGEVGGGAPVASAEAAQVLHSAADAALKAPFTPPRPDQFVYMRAENVYGTHESWSSVDGTHDGRYAQYGEEPGTHPGCRDGKAAVYKGPEPIPGEFESCTPDPRYIPDLPTDADAMLAYLKEPGHTRDPNSAYHMGEAVRHLISRQYMRPESRAALFEAAAKIPGITVVRDVADPSGRPGIGISFPSSDGTPHMLIFDRDSYAFLGTEFEARMEYAIVDEVGQLP